jgi:hypothetical protein
VIVVIGAAWWLAAAHRPGNASALVLEQTHGQIEQFIQTALVGTGQGTADVKFDVRVQGDALPVAARRFSGSQGVVRGW